MSSMGPILQTLLPLILSEGFRIRPYKNRLFCTIKLTIYALYLLIEMTCSVCIVLKHMYYTLSLVPPLLLGIGYSEYTQFHFHSRQRDYDEKIYSYLLWKVCYEK